MLMSGSLRVSGWGDFQYPFTLWRTRGTGRNMKWLSLSPPSPTLQETKPSEGETSSPTSIDRGCPLSASRTLRGHCQKSWHWSPDTQHPQNGPKPEGREEVHNEHTLRKHPEIGHCARSLLCVRVTEIIRAAHTTGSVAAREPLPFPGPPCDPPSCHSCCRSR